MKRLWCLPVLFLALAASCAILAAGAQEQVAPPPQKTEARGPLTPLERFDGHAAFHTKQGKSRELHVVVRKWEIHGRQHIEKFPEQGFMVVHLQSGRVITTIDGKEEKRSGGDFWTVAAGSTMGIQVTSESALLETAAVKKQ